MGRKRRGQPSADSAATAAAVARGTGDRVGVTGGGGCCVAQEGLRGRDLARERERTVILSPAAAAAAAVDASDPTAATAAAADTKGGRNSGGLVSWKSGRQAATAWQKLGVLGVPSGVCCPYPHLPLSATATATAAAAAAATTTTTTTTSWR